MRKPSLRCGQSFLAKVAFEQDFAQEGFLGIPKMYLASNKSYFAGEK